MMRGTFILTLVAMVAFAANSLLVRAALLEESIGPWSFTLIRLVSGALLLMLLVRPQKAFASGSWLSALALLFYAGFFSFAYLMLDAGMGALILFGMVQIGMISWGLLSGERLSVLKWLGIVLACAGLVYLVSPGLMAPSLIGSVTMVCAGLGWAAYSLRGRGVTNPTEETAGNFVRAAALTTLFSIPAFLLVPEARPETSGILLAIASGAITSGLGYAIWYKALEGHSASSAGIVQLSVPVLAALGGLLFLSEPLSTRLIVASALILGGIFLVMKPNAADQ